MTTGVGTGGGGDTDRPRLSSDRAGEMPRLLRPPKLSLLILPSPMLCGRRNRCQNIHKKGNFCWVSCLSEVLIEISPNCGVERKYNQEVQMNIQ